MYLQLHIFRIQYSAERIFAVIVDISTTQCALYCKLCAKYSAQPADCAVCTLVRTIYSVITAPHIQLIQYSAERICADIGDMSTIQCAL
jgi:hypothetical protein